MTHRPVTFLAKCGPSIKEGRYKKNTKVMAVALSICETGTMAEALALEEIIVTTYRKYHIRVESLINADTHVMELTLYGHVNSEG